MNILIAYTSKYGSTKKCLRYLENRINFDIDIIDIKKDKVKNLDSYNVVLVGGPIYMGLIQKDVKKFCQKNIDELLKKKLVFFISCVTPNQAEKFFNSNFPERLLNHSIGRINFGGEIHVNEVSFLEKQIIKKAEKKASIENSIFYENIDKLIELINIL